MPQQKNVWLSEPYELHVYKSDVIVKRKGPRNNGNQNVRSDVVNFTDDSRKRLAFVAANTDVTFRTMVTLTYPHDWPYDGKIVKRHNKAMLQALRRRYENPGYLWFLEFQKRGAPHFHVLLSAPTRITKHDKVWCSRRWYTIVGSGEQKHLLAGTRIELLRSPSGGAHYAVKYAMKMRQKAVPEQYRNVGRFWGHSRDVKPTVKYSLELKNGSRELFLLLDGHKYQYIAEKCVRTIYNASGSVMSNATNQTDGDRDNGRN